MAGDQRLLKRLNRMAIVRQVKAQPGLPRATLAARIGLADSTISVLVNELLREGWLRTSEGPSGTGAGRRPQLLSLNGDVLALVGAELGVDYIAVVACNLQGEVLASSIGDYHHQDLAHSARDLAARVAIVCQGLAAAGRRPLGLGVGLPGMVTLDGRLRLAPNVGWREVAITPLLAEALRAAGCEDLPFQALNDANAGALGESIFGAAPSARSLVFLGLGHGIGAGIVMDERLQAGHEGLSGEVGHSILERRGLPCACGRRGCAETLLSQRAVSRLITGQEEPVLTVDQLQARLEGGDERVEQALRVAGGHLGLLVHNLVVTIDPALVVLGGTMSRLEPFVASAIEEFRRLSGDVPDHHVTVRATRFGSAAGSIGAAASVLHDLGKAVGLTP